MRIASICLSTILEPVKDTRAYLLLATFNLFSLFIYFCLLFSFAPLLSVTRLVTLIVCILGVVILERTMLYQNVGSNGREQ